MFNETNLSQPLIDSARAFGLNLDELKKFCTALGRLPSREEMAVCGALWSEHCSYKSSRVHLRRFHTEAPWVLQGPGENAGVVSITKNWAIAFKMESHNHPSYIEPYQGAATGVGGILRDVFCMGAKPIASLNCLRFGEGEWNGTLVRNTVRGIGDYGNSVGVPTVTGDTSFHFGYSKNILINAFTAGLIHRDRIFKGVLTEKNEETEETGSVQAKDNEAQTPMSQVAQIALGIGLGATLTREANQVLFPAHENVLIYFGSATGRDGVHGATMSSAEFSPTGESLKPTVQVGDPFAEKVLLEATLALIASGDVVGLQDMGAAGLTSSSVEMAGRSGCGVAINLNSVPQRASNMQAFEILLSESQERMLAACAPAKVDKVMALLRSFDIAAGVIGRVNQTGLFTCVFDGRVCTSVNVGLLVDDTPRYTWPLQEREAYLASNACIQNQASQQCESPEAARASAESQNHHEKPVVRLKATDAKAHTALNEGVSLAAFMQAYPSTLATLLAHPMFCSRKPIFDHYCATVQGQTVAGCGALQSAAAAVVRLPREAQETDAATGKLSQVGLAVAGGCEERWVEIDPLNGAALSTLKIARKIIAVGGTPLALTDCLNFGSPAQPPVMRQLSDAIDGINLVAKHLQIPVVSGNVSLNNQTGGKPIPPTPMIGMVGRVDNVAHVPLDALPPGTLSTRQEPSQLHFVRLSAKPGFADSSYLCSQTSWILGGENRGPLPAVDLAQEARCWQVVKNALGAFHPPLCVPVGQGGTLVTLLKMVLGSLDLPSLAWAKLALEQAMWDTQACDLFAEGNAGFIMALESREAAKSLLDLVASEGLAGSVLGVLHINSTMTDPQEFNLAALSSAWKSGLVPFFKA